MKSTTTSGKKADGFRIRRAGEYMTRDGRCVAVYHQNVKEYPWRNLIDGAGSWKPDGTYCTEVHRKEWDIVSTAAVPATPPRATKASRGGKPSRYAVYHDGAKWFAVRERNSRTVIAREMTRSTARKLAAWLNADAGERGGE